MMTNRLLAAVAVCIVAVGCSDGTDSLTTDDEAGSQVVEQTSMTAEVVLPPGSTMLGPLVTDSIDDSLAWLYFVADGEAMVGRWNLDRNELSSTSIGTEADLTGPPAPPAIASNSEGVVLGVAHHLYEVHREGLEVRDLVSSDVVKAALGTWPITSVAYNAVSGTTAVGSIEGSSMLFIDADGVAETMSIPEGHGVSGIVSLGPEPTFAVGDIDFESQTSGLVRVLDAVSGDEQAVAEVADSYPLGPWEAGSAVAGTLDPIIVHADGSVSQLDVAGTSEMQLIAPAALPDGRVALADRAGVKIVRIESGAVEGELFLGERSCEVAVPQGVEPTGGPCPVSPESVASTSSGQLLVVSIGGDGQYSLGRAGG